MSLSENELASRPGGFGQLASLARINLSENQRASRPGGVDQLASQAEINRGKNQLASMPSTSWRIGWPLCPETSASCRRQGAQPLGSLASRPGDFHRLTSVTALYLLKNRPVRRPATSAS